MRALFKKSCCSTRLELVKKHNSSVLSAFPGSPLCPPPLPLPLLHPHLHALLLHGAFSFSPAVSLNYTLHMCTCMYLTFFISCCCGFLRLFFSFLSFHFSFFLAILLSPRLFCALLQTGHLAFNSFPPLYPLDRNNGVGDDNGGGNNNRAPMQVCTQEYRLGVGKQLTAGDDR